MTDPSYVTAEANAAIQVLFAYIVTEFNPSPEQIDGVRIRLQKLMNEVSDNIRTMIRETLAEEMGK